MRIYTCYIQSASIRKAQLADLPLGTTGRPPSALSFTARAKDSSDHQQLIIGIQRMAKAAFPIPKPAQI